MQAPEERRRVLRKNNAESKREVRNCIKTALLRLLEHKEYEEIRMTDIIRKSGVSRMGVYNNYKNKDEILIDLCVSPLDKLVSTPNDSLRANLEWAFQTAYQNKKAVLTLIDAGLSHVFLDLLNERYASAAESFYFPIWNGLLYNTVIEWVKSGTDETPESAAARMLEALQQCAKTIQTGTIRDPGSPADAAAP